MADPFLVNVSTLIEDLAFWIEAGQLLLGAELLEEGDFITMTIDGEQARRLRDWLNREFPSQE